MRNRIFKFAKLIFPCIVTITIGFILFKRVDLTDFRLSFSKANFPFLLLTVVCSVFYTLFVCVYKYKYTLRFLGYDIPTNEARIIRLGSLPLKSITPFKAGEFFRAIYLRKNFDMPYEKGIYSIFLGYLLRSLILGIFILAGWLGSIIGLWVGLLAALSVFVLTVFIFGVKNFRLLFYSFLSELCLFLNYFIVLKAFNIQIPLTSVFFFVPLILFLESLPISVAGLGIREGAFILFFLDEASAGKLVASGIVASFVNGLIPVFLGLLFMSRFITEFAFKKEAVGLNPGGYLREEKVKSNE